MITHAEIPISYPLKPKQILVQVVSENGVTNLIEAVINDQTIEFVKDADGFFKAKTMHGQEKSFVSYIERQLSRTFA